MSDGTAMRNDDLVTARLVTDLDLLPVPAGPGHLRPQVTHDLARRPVIVLALLVLLLGVGLTVAPLRDAAADAARSLEQLLTAPAWTGYYIDLSATTDTGFAANRIVFTAGSFPGMTTKPDIVVPGERRADRGPWSPDGERIPLHAGTRLLVGDRLGRVRQLADFAPMFPVRSGWIGSSAILVALHDGIRGEFARVDLRIGTVTRRPDPFPDLNLAYAPFSPDGQWVPFTMRLGGCFEENALAYMSTDRLVELKDGTGRPLTAIGWLSDGRLISAWCDAALSRMHLLIGFPETGPSPLATIPWHSGQAAPFIDRPRDRVLFSTHVGNAPGVLSAIEPDGRIAEVVRIPSLTKDDAFGGIDQLYLSRDGRYLAFRVRETVAFQPTYRAGLIEVATGQVLYACPFQCHRLAVR